MRTIVVIACLLTCINLYGQRTIIIGAMPFKTPFTTQGDKKGDFYGFEISMMNEICTRINAHCIYKPKNVQELLKSILNNDIDLAIGGLVITKTRKQNYIFSLPYLISSGGFLVKSNSKYTTIDDLRYKKVGIVKGSVYGNIVHQKLGPQVKIKTYLYIPDLLSGLLNDEVDAAIIDQETAQYWAAKEDNLVMLGPPMPTGSGYAIMANKSNEELIGRINRTILRMESDGTYLKLYREFFD